MLNRRLLFHREAPEDGGGGGEAPAGVADPPADLGGSELGEGAPAAATPEAFSISRDEWEQTQAGLSQIGEYLQFMQQQQAQGGEPEDEGFDFDLDPLEDSFGESLAQLVQNVVQQAIAPLHQQAQAAQLAEGEERTWDILDDYVSQNGEFVDQEGAFSQARALANSLLQEEVQRYGWGPRAGEAAIRRAADTIRARDKAVGEAALEKYKNELGTLGSAPREPGAAGVGTQVIGGERPDSLKDLVGRHFPG